jgi:hypothetical protein
MRTFNIGKGILMSAFGHGIGAITVRFWPASASLPKAAHRATKLHFRLLRNLQCIIDFNTKISYGAFELDVP